MATTGLSGISARGCPPCPAGRVTKATGAPASWLCPPLPSPPRTPWPWCTWAELSPGVLLRIPCLPSRPASTSLFPETDRKTEDGRAEWRPATEAPARGRVAEGGGRALLSNVLPGPGPPCHCGRPQLLLVPAPLASDATGSRHCPGPGVLTAQCSESAGPFDPAGDCSSFSSSLWSRPLSVQADPDNQTPEVSVCFFLLVHLLV